MHILKWLKQKILWFILGGVAFTATMAIAVTPPVVPDANPVIGELKHFNFNGVKTRQGGNGSFVGGYTNYMKNGEWVPVNYTFIQTPEGFCMDKAPFKACAPLRSTGQTVFHNNNEFDLHTLSKITDPTVDKKVTALGVNDVAGQILTGDLMTPGGMKYGVSYVLYAGAYNDADLIYFINTYDGVPALAEFIRWNTKPICSLPILRNFEWEYSQNMKFEYRDSLNQLKEWKKQSTLNIVNTIDNSIIVEAINTKRGIGEHPFYIWDTNADDMKIKKQRIPVTLMPLAGNKIKFTKVLPCNFFTNANYPVYTDTTSTFNPDTGSPGTNSIDGQAWQNVGDAGDTWANIRAAAGNNVLATNGTMNIGIADQNASGNGYQVNVRGFLSFYTGPTISSGATINSETLQLTMRSTNNEIGNSVDMRIGQATGSFTNSLAASEYPNANNTSLMTEDHFEFSNHSAGTATTSTLNATARDEVGKGGTAVTRFALKTVFDFANSPTPATSNNALADTDDWRFDSADGTTKPLLTVDWSEAAAAGVNEEEGMIPSFIWKLYDIKVFVYYNLLPLAYAYVGISD